MKNPNKLSMAEMKEFVQGSQAVEFQKVGGEQAYRHVESVLKGHSYQRLGREEKGVVRAYLAKTTGLSRAQIGRLIRQWKETRQVKRKPAVRPRVRRKYTAEDVALLAEVDAAHEDLSGAAVRHLLRRGWEVENNEAFQRLRTISASHIYNLRKRTDYKKLRIRWSPTRARQVGIGERRCPDPRGRPGYVRVDTVHQGIHDGKAGVYHVNAVDSVTQWQVVGCVEAISEFHLLPVLEAILHQFPFQVQGFHSDNGGEYINKQVAKMLNRLKVKEFTKSRANRSNDNALVEGKNGAVVRKHLGYGPISTVHAGELQKYYTAVLNPYLNFHRPCGFATVLIQPNGKRKRIYRLKDYQTPYEKLTSLPDWEELLKPGVTKERLDQQARRLSDTEAARQMSDRKAQLLARFRSVAGFGVYPVSGEPS